MSVVVAVVVYRTFCLCFSLFRIFCKVKKKTLIAEVGEFKL